MTDTQSKYLSPREILKIFKFLEKWIPLINYGDYVPDMSQAQTGYVSEAQLDAEAVRMLAFMGMYTYTPVCRYNVSLPASIGGEIKLEGKTSGDVHISLNPKLKSSPRELLACLAHELCHKRLEDSQIKFPDTEEGKKELEYHTDLCTIYMGFGKWILRGYNVGNNAMGYLRPEIYRHALSIIRSVRGGDSVTEPVRDDAFNDIFLDEALAKWNQTPDKHQCLKETFMAKMGEVAELARNIELSRQILARAETFPQKHLEWYSDAYANYDLRKDLNAYPIQAFATFYDMETEPFDDIFKDRMRGLNHALLSFMGEADAHLPQSGDDAPDYTRIVCPFCRAVTRSPNADGTSRLVKCNQCKRFFVINRTHIDFAKMNEQARHKLRGSATILASMIIDEAKDESYKRGNADGRREAEARYTRQIEEMQRAHKSETMAKYRQGIEAGKSTGRDALTCEILSGIPPILRLLIKPFIRKK